MSTRVYNFRYFGLWRNLGLLMLGIAVIVFLAPVPPTPPTFSLEDKLVHFLIFAVLAFWFIQIYSHHLRVMFVLVVIGIAIEGLQSMTSYRSAEFADILANTAGVIGGWIFSRLPIGGLIQKIDQQLAAMKDRQS